MNYKRMLALVVMMGILLLGTSQVTGQQDEPQSLEGTYGYAFTYQGQLNGPGGPVNGQCDLRFKLWDAASGGSQVGWTWLLEGEEIVEGLFTARLDFGSVHDGNARWLEVAVRCPAGSGDYVTLGPRQELTAAPAALSLAMPFYAEANIGGPLVSFVNTSGDGEAALFRSQGAALWVESAGTDGLHVGSAGQNGVAVSTAGTNGVHVNTASANGMHINTAGADGVLVSTASARGLVVDAAGDDGVYVGAAGNPSTVRQSENANGVEVGGAQGYGLYVGRADEDGVFVESAGGSGLYVGSALRDGLVVGSASWTGAIIGMVGWDGVAVAMAGNSGWGVGSEESNGFEVGGAQGYGLFVGHAGMDGVYVNSAGSPSSTSPGPVSNGFEVAGAEGNGLYVGRADMHGVQVSSAAYNGVYVAEAGDDGVSVSSAGWDGVYVGSAGWDGFHVEQATDDGVAVVSAGNPSDWPISSYHNGFEVRGAEGYGLYVGRADLDGVYVNSTAWHGLNVAGAGVDGLYVSSAGSDGVDVTGGTYAGNFHGNIYVSGDCIGCTTAVFGLNAGDGSLEPGQIVAIQGVEATALDNSPTLWRVVPAGEGAAAVGVVRGKAELDEAAEGTTLREGETGQRLVPRFGVAQPGGYLTIVISGPMQVKVSTADGAIEPGTRLAVGEMGAARALQTVVVEGLTLAESAPTIGIALSAPDGDGLVWVLVNPQ